MPQIFQHGAGPRPQHRPSRPSVAFFLQQALNTFFGYTLAIDGEYADNTAKALNAVLTRLAIGDVAASVAHWIRFLEFVCESGLVMAADALDAKVTLDRHRGEMHNSLAVLDEEEPVHTALIRTLRSDIGLIDVTYKPFPNWRIRSSTTANGTPQWFVDFDATSDFYLSNRFNFPPHTGLARIGTTSAPKLPYDHVHYRQQFGEWASFVHPTGRCESEATCRECLGCRSDDARLLPDGGAYGRTSRLAVSRVVAGAA